MAEDGESPGIARANGLRQEAAGRLAGMRANAVGNALGGQGDPRPVIETALGTANTQLAEAQRWISGASREPVAQTPDGKRIFEDLARQVGYESPSSATTTVETAPAVGTKSPSIITRIKSFFRK